MSITNPAVCRCPRKPRFTAWFRRDWTCPRCGRAWFSIRRWDGLLPLTPRRVRAMRDRPTCPECGEPLHPAKVGDVIDMGAPEPPNVIGVESLAWANYGDGYGPTLADETDARDPEAELLHFGKTNAPSIDGDWKFYLGGKTYTDWETVLRRFGPVRVTHASKENPDD